MASPDCVRHKTIRRETVLWCSLCWESWDLTHEYMEELVKLRQEVVQLRDQIQTLRELRLLDDKHRTDAYKLEHGVTR